MNGYVDEALRAGLSKDTIARWLNENDRDFHRIANAFNLNVPSTRSGFIAGSLNVPSVLAPEFNIGGQGSMAIPYSIQPAPPGGNTAATTIVPTSSGQMMTSVASLPTSSTTLPTNVGPMPTSAPLALTSSGGGSLTTTAASTPAGSVPPNMLMLAAVAAAVYFFAKS